MQKIFVLWCAVLMLFGASRHVTSITTRWTKWSRVYDVVLSNQHCSHTLTFMHTYTNTPLGRVKIKCEENLICHFLSKASHYRMTLYILHYYFADKGQQLIHINTHRIQLRRVHLLIHICVCVQMHAYTRINV